MSTTSSQPLALTRTDLIRSSNFIAGQWTAFPGPLMDVTNPATGAVITSAGLIFAASMFGLMVGSVAIMIQAGLIIGFGLLLDTFLVRTLTVPAIATLLREASWWPHRPQRRPKPSPSPQPSPRPIGAIQ